MEEEWGYLLQYFFDAIEIFLCPVATESLSPGCG